MYIQTKLIKFITGKGNITPAIENHKNAKRLRLHVYI